MNIGIDINKNRIRLCTKKNGRYYEASINGIDCTAWTEQTEEDLRKLKEELSSCIAKLCGVEEEQQSSPLPIRLI